VSVDFITDHDHGILVIEQLGSRSTHDDWDVYAEGAHSEGDSLYVGVLPPMEGRVSTSVRRDASEPDHEDLTLVFDGRLTVASKELVIGDSDRNVEVRLPARSGAVHLEVLVDVVGLASRVLVLLRDE